MNEIIQIIKSLNIPIIMELIMAIGVIIVFKIISPFLSKLIIKIITPQIKEKKDLKKHPLYLPLKTVIIFIGISIGISIIRETGQINENILNTITKVVKILMILLVAKAFSQGLDFKKRIKLTSKSEEPIDRTTQKFVINIIKIAIYTIAGFMVITELGYDITGIIAGLGIGGVVITLAAQDTAKSLIGGIAIFLDKPFKIGDYIKVGEYEGTVEDIKFRSTNIRTLDNSVLHIPNSEVSISAVINYSEIKKRRIYAKITINKDIEIEKIKKLENKIQNMLMGNNIVEKESVSVSFKSISDNGIDIIIMAYVYETNYNNFLKIKEEINYQTLKILREEKIELAYNTQTIYVKK